MLETTSPIRCPKCQVEMKGTMTKAGVIIDRCGQCGGTWMDGGEIFHFAHDRQKLYWALEQGLRNPHPTQHPCPRCGTPLTEGGILSDSLLLDHCASCEGLWFDEGELKLLQSIEARGFEPAGETGPPPQPPMPGTVVAAAATASVYKLFASSAAVLGLLFGLLFLGLAIAAEAGAFPLWVALVITVGIVFIQFMISPWIMDVMLRWVSSLHWASREELPPHMAAFLDHVAKEHNIPFPSVGIIEDGTPNAFTYGHMPSNARVVVTRGLLNILTPEETEAVLGHEMGHALHWDMLVITVASIVPMVLYFIFRVAIRIKSRKNNPGPIIAAVAYILYIISEYVLLWLSRTREYYADGFSGKITGKPSALAAALTKIAYGLAGNTQAGTAEEGEARRQDSKRLEAVRALGIFDPGSARSMVAAAAGVSAAPIGSAPGVSTERLKDAMQWDLWNPWASWHEIHSTHPLPAKRIQRLSDQSEVMGQAPYVRFDRRKPESYWDDFFLDVLVLMLPWILGIAGLAAALAQGSQPLAVLGLAVMGLGAGSLVSTLYRYRGGVFPKSSVAGLLKHVKVSGVTPVAATIRGRIIGRGIPGLVWSEDIVLQDATGYLFCDYRQPLGIIEFLFGLFRTKGIIGRDVTATGWYRRAPTPFLELRSFSYTDGGEVKTHNCYAMHAKLVFEAVLVAGGFVLLFVK